jgi:hypothetical protein
MADLKQLQPYADELAAHQLAHAQEIEEFGDALESLPEEQQLERLQHLIRRQRDAQGIVLPCVS